MNKYILEACVDSGESAQAAAEGGATRLELCSGLVIGGLTPSRFLYEEIKRELDIKIHVLIRPRFGDFCYTEQEFTIIKKEVEYFREAGADGLVVGFLKPDGMLDCCRMEEVVRLAGEVPVTLHRAYDVCREPFEALEEAAGLGVSAILTSGQKNSCLEGSDFLRILEERSAGRVTILAAGGVNAAVIRSVESKTGIKAFHMSGKTNVQSSMEYRKEEVHMGLPSLSEYEIWRTDVSQIRAAVKTLKEITGGCGYAR